MSCRQVAHDAYLEAYRRGLATPAPDPLTDDALESMFEAWWRQHASHHYDMPPERARFVAQDAVHLRRGLNRQVHSQSVVNYLLLNLIYSLAQAVSDLEERTPRA